MSEKNLNNPKALRFAESVVSDNLMHTSNLRELVSILDSKRPMPGQVWRIKINKKIEQFQLTGKILGLITEADQDQSTYQIVLVTLPSEINLELPGDIKGKDTLFRSQSFVVHHLLKTTISRENLLGCEGRLSEEAFNQINQILDGSVLNQENSHFKIIESVSELEEDMASLFQDLVQDWILKSTSFENLHLHAIAAQSHSEKALIQKEIITLYKSENCIVRFSSDSSFWNFEVFFQEIPEYFALSGHTLQETEVFSFEFSSNVPVRNNPLHFRIPVEQIPVPITELWFDLILPTGNIRVKAEKAE